MKVIETRKASNDPPPPKAKCFSCKKVMFRNKESFMILEQSNGFDIFCCDLCFDTEENNKYKFLESN